MNTVNAITNRSILVAAAAVGMLLQSGVKHKEFSRVLNVRSNRNLDLLAVGKLR
jgi:hypothetical protein